MQPLALITDEPQAKRLANGQVSRTHLPAVADEADAIKGAFGPFAERRSRISAGQLHDALLGKQIWFFPGHGDALLLGDPVLAFEKDGSIEAVSMETLVGIVGWHVNHGNLRLIVLTGCHTSKLGQALHERAGVPDVVCWTTVLHDQAGKSFGAEIARITAQQLFGGKSLDAAAAFSAACMAVTSLTEPGKLDNGLEGEVQQFELHVDPKDEDYVDPKSGRVRASGRLAAGSPLLLSSLQRARMSITVDNAPVPETPDFHRWCTFHEVSVGGQMVLAQHMAKKLFIYHAIHTEQPACTATHDEAGNPWSSIITRDASGLAYNGKAISVVQIKSEEANRRRR